MGFFPSLRWSRPSKLGFAKRGMKILIRESEFNSQWRQKLLLIQSWWGKWLALSKLDSWRIKEGLWRSDLGYLKLQEVLCFGWLSPDLLMCIWSGWAWSVSWSLQLFFFLDSESHEVSMTVERWLVWICLFPECYVLLSFPPVQTSSPVFVGIMKYMSLLDALCQPNLR